MQKLKLTIIIFLGFGASALSQDFLAPYSSFIGNNTSYVITQAGDSIAGTLRSVSQDNGIIKRVVLLDENKQVHKFGAEELRRFAIKPDDFAKMDAISDNSFSIRQMTKTDYHEIIQREWLIYETQQLPRKKNKFGMLQLLNPGFDQHIKVYHHPFGSKSMPVKLAGIRIIGGEDRTLLVVKNGQQAQIVRKVSYDKSFTELFSDELELMNEVDRKPKFKNFAAHIFAYNDLKGTVYYYATSIK